jgi:nucleoside-diphosphate-sugar epimerase
MSGRVVLISGADGFLGRALTDTFAAAGWQVFGLIRNLSAKKPPAALSGAFEYSFPDRMDPAALDIPADLFIHNAFLTRMTADVRTAVNVEAARFLLERFAARGRCRFAFVSSMAAHPDACSRYGLEKLAIEKMMDPARQLVIRPGFIVGYGGVFRRLTLMLSRTPVVPLFYGGSLPIHTVHIGDVCRALLALVEGERAGVWPLGEPSPLTIRAFYGSIVEWLGKRSAFMPLPGAPFLHLLRLVERLGVRPPLTSENLLGLKGLTAYDMTATIAALGFRPAAFPESLSRIDRKVLMETACLPS